MKSWRKHDGKLETFLCDADPKATSDSICEQLRGFSVFASGSKAASTEQ